MPSEPRDSAYFLRQQAKCLRLADQCPANDVAHELRIMADQYGKQAQEALQPSAADPASKRVSGLRTAR
jgi:hypothetical protein